MLAELAAANAAFAVIKLLCKMDASWRMRVLQ